MATTPTDDAPGEPGPRDAARRDLPRRLSTRLVWLTMLAVMAAEILILVPSVANFQSQWLARKVETATIASQAFASSGGATQPPAGSASRLLDALGVELIAVESEGASRLIARSEEIGMVERVVDLRQQGFAASVASALDTIFLGRGRTVRVLAEAGSPGWTGEVVVSETELRATMVAFARKFLAISLIVALFAGLLLNLAIHRMLVVPIRELTRSMIRFAEQPEDPARIVVPSGRDDELGVAGRELAHMQARLAQTLRERRHLADLGLAVSKINHDLRNTLASAQLVSDRLSDIPDPEVQRFAPTLIRSLDRALTYTRSVLAYGRAVEDLPVRRQLRLAILVDEILEVAGAQADPRIALVNAVPSDFELEVDPDQFHRALSNLVRNAVEALQTDAAEALVRRVTVSAEPHGTGSRIIVEDTGPGLSAQAQTTLFQAFRGSTRSGGTGLGLAIAAEIVEAHGGRIRYCERPTTGARFEIDLP